MSKLEEETWNPKYLLKDKVTVLSAGKNKKNKKNYMYNLGE